ncbi:Zinc-specific metallo-regulatory protein [bioreactor metagenome]|uniref:Zinc-specific metallo-regulatory protein n=1 Tax=bioreactor metagenome TaxID=1076179 RepID=A0A644T0D8_9ZZZZ|nr:Fur family transcriptional regulator [Negativicutes bacterium]
MEDFIAILRREGYKITPQRRAVIAALNECGKFATAHQVLAYVKDKFPDMSLDTVYRNLGLLVGLGLVHEVQTKGRRDGNLFEISGDEHHHHLVCLSCGKAECIDFCPIHAENVIKAEEGGFKIKFHALEFYGYCRDCIRTS